MIDRPPIERRSPAPRGPGHLLHDATRDTYSSADLPGIGANAVEYAVHKWPIFPLRGKIPAIPKLAGGNGVLDATTDAAQIAQWWGGRYAGCNIGGRVPDSMMVLDIDPRHGDDRCPGCVLMGAVHPCFPGCGDAS